MTILQYGLVGGLFEGHHYDSPGQTLEPIDLHWLLNLLEAFNERCFAQAAKLGPLTAEVEGNPYSPVSERNPYSPASDGNPYSPASDGNPYSPATPKTGTSQGNPYSPATPKTSTPQGNPYSPATPKTSTPRSPWLKYTLLANTPKLPSKSVPTIVELMKKLEHGRDVCLRNYENKYRRDIPARLDVARCPVKPEMLAASFAQLKFALNDFNDCQRSHFTHR